MYTGGVVGVARRARLAPSALPALASALPVGQLVGALHVPVDSIIARVGLIFLAPAVLSLFVPVAIAVRQHLLGRRAMPCLLVAAIGPVVIGAIVGA